jgi:acetyl esterase/lipase
LAINFPARQQSLSFRSMKKYLLLVLLGFSVGLNPLHAAASAVSSTRTEDVVYGRKFGTALTLDVFRPDQPNGAAVLFMVSGGFNSNHSGVNARNYELFLAGGYTVFAVVHGSQPKFHVVEILEDIHRAVRFIRHNATRFGIDPQKLGVTGTSSGGHLSLMLGLTGGPGKADAKDPIDRESSAVQAVACFCPPTDFMNWSGPGDDELGVGEIGTRFKGAWDARIATREGREQLSREVSPIHFVSARMAPTLVLHGDADKLVSPYQAQIFEEKCQSVGAPYRLVMRAGKDHGWPEMATDRAQFVAWFDQHLRGGTK